MNPQHLTLDIFDTQNPNIGKLLAPSCQISGFLNMWFFASTDHFYDLCIPKTWAVNGQVLFILFLFLFSFKKNFLIHITGHSLNPWVMCALPDCNL